MKWVDIKKNLRKGYYMPFDMTSNFFTNMREKYIGWPKAATTEEWGIINNNAKTNHPILYFLLETLPSEVSYFQYCIRQYYWWVMHRIHPDHRYHIIHTGLKPNYYDIDTIMLHGMMSLLVRYVEDEHDGIDDLINWNNELKQRRINDEFINEDQISSDEEAIVIYNWWKNGRPQKQKILDDYKLPYEELDRLELNLTDEDTEMLTRLVKIRKSLWT